MIYSCNNKQKADLIIYNANIYTVDSSFSKVQAFAVRNGKYIAVGESDQILASYQSDSCIDAKGKFVFPGFIDAHSHFYGYGLSLMRVDLVGTDSFDEVIERVITHQKTHKQPWVLGRGWDQNDWSEKVFPTNKKLNDLFPDTPVYITRIDGHAALANQKALQLAGINAQTKISGGNVMLDFKGFPTGILIDNAMTLVENIIPKPNKQTNIEALNKAAENCYGVGLTTVCDAGLDKEIALLIDSLQKNGELKMKIYAMLNPTVENIEYFVKQGVYLTENISVRSLKLYADGALGSRGACLKKPYADAPETSGLVVTETDSVKKICEIGLKYGYQVNTHAIGDSAVNRILEIYALYLKGKNDLRWRIEHSQVVAANDVVKFGLYSIVPAINTTHATSDMLWAGIRLGSERIKTAYAYKSLLEQNNWLCNGSDFPIESINPILGFYAAVFRKDIKGFPPEGFQPENALTRTQALKAMTIWAAKSFFEEKTKGSIEVGKSADFVILDKDIMTVSEEEIPFSKVLCTYINGKKCFFRR